MLKVTKPQLRDLNAHITCSICFGYLIDATTVIECLCTFCKTCIVKHLEEHNTCPNCKELIHHSHPREHIRFDRTLQTIVYKVVPGLQEQVERLQREYEAAHQEPVVEEQEEEKGSDTECNGETLPLPPPPLVTKDTNGSAPRRIRSPLPPMHTTNDYIVPVQVDIHKATLNGNRNDTEPDEKKSRLGELAKPILGCPARCPIRVIKKLVQTKLKVQDGMELDILCNDEILGKDHTLEFIKMTRWRTKDLPLVLTYRVRPDI